MKRELSIMKPQNFEERLVWYAIIGTYGVYLVGAQPIFIPIIAWLLTLYLCKQLWNQTNKTPINDKIVIPFTVRVWIISMLVILFGLYIAHMNFDLGGIRLIKSFFKWTREYALWALFPLIGSCLKIRPQLLYRASCILCLQSLFFIPICYLGFLLHLPPNFLYYSPLSRIGGNARDLYGVVLYFLDDQTNQVRLALFAPWAPNLAFVAIIYFFLVRQESNKKWRLIGMIGAIAMIVTPISRAGMLWFPIVILLTWILANFTRPIIYLTAGVVSFLITVFSNHASNFLEIFTDKLYSSRAGSSYTRIIAFNLAIDSWWNEAPIWGHGVVQGGPGVMFFLPLGTSCGTWASILYTKGLVGFIAFALPLLWSFIDLVNKAQKSAIARVGLSILLVFFFFSFTEDLDNLAYLYWPGLLMIGIALQGEVQASVSAVINARQPLLKS